MKRLILRHRYLAPLLLVLVAGPAPALFFYATPWNGASNADFHPPRAINPADIGVPPGYGIEAVATGLTYPSAVVMDDRDRVYVVEAGYSYGEDFTVPRLLRVEPDGGLTVVASGDKGEPWTGAAFANGGFYISEGGKFREGRILRVAMDGKITPLLDGIPTLGDHHTDPPAVGPDGWIYFGVGSATNSGVVGPDNAQFGWLKRFPDAHDIPPCDVVLSGQNFVSDDALNPECGKTVTTGAFVPYGTPTCPGQVIKGQLPCTGAILRIPPSGGKPEMVAWGFRDPFGLGFAPDGSLYAADNMYDERGSRPVFGAGDLFWKVQPGLWYGFPDYWGSVPLTHPRFAENKTEPRPRFLLAQHPNTPPEPVARLGVRSSSDGFDFSRNPDFGHVGEAFIAVFGDMTGPSNGKVLHPVGCRVVRVDPCNGVIQDFVVNQGLEAGPASKECNGGIERPVSCRFNNGGDALYVVDFGVITRSAKGPQPYPGTGVLWRVRPCGEGAVYRGGPKGNGAWRRGEAIGRPIVVKTDAEVRGQVIFCRNCYPCHQGGEGGLGPTMLLFPDPIVRTQVRLGLGPMPSFCRDEVSAAELNDLIAYVKAARGSAHPFLLHD